MNFFSLLLKKVTRKWLNVIPILLVSIFIIVVYKGEYTGSYVMRNTEYCVQEIASFKKDVSTFEEEIKNYEPGSNAYKNTEYNLNEAKQMYTLLQSRLNAFKNKDWQKYYESEMKITDTDLERVYAIEGNYDESLIEIYHSRQVYNQFMLDHQLPFDDWLSYSQGISFMTHVLNNYLPVILAFLLIFITSNMYCSSYMDKMDIHVLLPMKKVKKQGIKLLAGWVFGGIILMFFIILSILLGSFGNALGNLQSPILTYTRKGMDSFIPFISILPQLLILITLSILMIVNFVSVVAMFTKKNMICLIISVGIILGFMWMTTNIVPISSMVHVLPTTYFNSLKVISGEMMYTTGNINVNFFNGMIVLGLSNIALFAMHYAGSIFSIRRNGT